MWIIILKFLNTKLRMLSLATTVLTILRVNSLQAFNSFALMLRNTRIHVGIYI